MGVKTLLTSCAIPAAISPPIALNFSLSINLFCNSKIYFCSCIIQNALLHIEFKCLDCLFYHSPIMSISSHRNYTFS